MSIQGRIPVTDSGSGLFYVIEGFLDILLPEPTGPSVPEPKCARQSEVRTSKSDTPAFEKHATPRTPRTSANKDRSPKPLFTVKPGGIAGYLCMLC